MGDSFRVCQNKLKVLSQPGKESVKRVTFHADFKNDINFAIRNHLIHENSKFYIEKLKDLYGSFEGFCLNDFKLNENFIKINVSKIQIIQLFFIVSNH